MEKFSIIIDHQTPEIPVPSINAVVSSEKMEYYSCAASLSDMEIFIFPNLMYSLVLANIMSPEIWKWRENSWFTNIEKKSFTYKVNRVKQYIMDHFVFNLDLDTWGLTDKQTEIDRFKDFINMDALSQSNALFGYEGDRYYFNIDIRRHFGLDKYQENIIPYWKTETIEAMQAFQYKENYHSGAGECVSLAALYVSALFVVGRIPLEKMFLIATPLHSQNFIAEKEGFMTNNRRIVTKNMWYNGTELSAKARRAVENEKITIVSHLSGYIHTFYPEASIQPEDYSFFRQKFESFLQSDFNFENFVNFLFSQEKYWNCFQYKHMHNGKECYISMRNVFNAQKSSKNRFGNGSRAALLEEMEAQAFSQSPLAEKILINDFESYLTEHPKLSFEAYSDYFLKTLLIGHCANVYNMFEEIAAFLHITPRLPNEKEKKFPPLAESLLHISTQDTREEILTNIKIKAKEKNSLATLAMYTYRDMELISWEPFLKAAIERNPVCIEACSKLSIEEIYHWIEGFPNESIYSEKRLAQPDEVWNFKRGDGIEKAILLMNIAVNTNYICILDANLNEITLEINTPNSTPKSIFSFGSVKNFKKHLKIQKKD